MSRMINLSGFNPIKKVVTTAGTPVKLSPYFTDTSIAFNNNSGTPPTAATYDTITDSNNGFVNAGFKDGDLVVVSGSTSNDGTYEIKTVAAGTLTLNFSGRLTTEIAGDTVTLESKKGIKVEDGVAVVVKANYNNTSLISLAPTSARAIYATSSYFSNFRLSANQSVSLQVKNLNEIWMDSVVSGEGVEILFEK